MKKDPSGWLLMTDLDGSLLNSQKQISEENQEAIKRFIARGGFFSIATGRTELTCNIVTDLIRPNAPIVLYNGSVIYDINRHETLWEEVLPFAVFQPMLREVMEKWPEVCIQVFAGGPLMLINEKGIDDPYIANEHQAHVRISVEEVPERVRKIMFNSSQHEILEEIRGFVQKYSEDHAMGEFEMFFTAECYLEIVSRNCSKGECLNRICTILGLEKEHTVAFGDHFNDLDMLRNAGISLVPENGIAQAKELADYCVNHHDHSPLAVFLEEHFEL